MCRSAPTDEPACSSSIAIVTVLPLVAARAYCPISTPALKLFVAKSAFVALFGTVGSVERDHEHAGLAGFRDRGILGLPVGDGDQDPLDACGHHVLDRSDLAGVVRAALAGRVEELGPALLRLGSRTLLHLHEERIRDVLRDQTDLDRRGAPRRRGRSRPQPPPPRAQEAQSRTRSARANRASSSRDACAVSFQETDLCGTDNTTAPESQANPSNKWFRSWYWYSSET